MEKQRKNLSFVLVIFVALFFSSVFAQPGIIINATGDIMLSKQANYQKIKGLGPAVFAKTYPLFEEGDINFANLESPFTNAPVVIKKKWAFTTPPERLNWILGAGLNLFSLANNHMGDAGLQGVMDTLSLLRGKKQQGAGFYWAGAGKTASELFAPVFFTVKEIRFGFLSFGKTDSPYVASVYSPKTFGAVSEADKKCDFLIVSSHLGEEYNHVPGKEVIAKYRKFVDAGADLILGHHPHVLQGIELYRGRPIFYSLGNYAFSTTPTSERKKREPILGMIARIYLSGTKPVKLAVFPLYVDNNMSWTLAGYALPANGFIPKPLTGLFASRAIQLLNQWSQAIPGNTLRLSFKNDSGETSF